jgi:GTPase
LIADRNVASLLAFRDHPHRRAGSGTHGTSKDMHGARGKELTVAVPEGTTVRDLHTDELLVDLAAHGDRWLAAEGGRGGRGNARFLSNRLRAPAFAEQGEQGQERWMKMELRLFADVALVGFPNAGKSTLISVISAAKPKIADYPFTTLEPNLGVVRLDDTTEYVVADIPGLIEGASEGRGLGHRFLRHVERARVLCVLLDLASVDGTSPGEQERVLLHELGAYRPELLERPRVVVGSKADVAGDDVEFAGTRISAATRQGVRDLCWALAREVSGARNAEPVPDGFTVHRPAGHVAVSIVADAPGVWRVEGREAQRAVALSDLTNLDALAHADRRLKELGVAKALARAGAQAGDTVLVGAFSFDYEPDA